MIVEPAIKMYRGTGTRTLIPAAAVSLLLTCLFLLRRPLLPQQVPLVILATIPGMHHDNRMNPDFVFYFTKKEDYFLRMPTTTSRTTPIAAMIVAIPTGDFVWIGYGVCKGVGGAVFARVCTCVWAGTFTVCCTAEVCAVVTAAVGTFVVAPPNRSVDPNCRKQ
jgi:hypothetical protein